MTQPWQNRITGYGEEAPDQLLANPSNFRTHPRHQQAALLGVLEDVGVVQDVIVSRNSGFIVDGHLRVMLALRTNQPTIPVKYVDLTPAEEALILASLDPISALAGTDAAKLSDLLHEVSTTNSDVLALLDGLATQAGIVPGLDPLSPGAGGDEFDTTPADGPTRTQRGELWSLGDHRLLVDDCTVAANVSWLMDGRRADIGIFDPPYGMRLDASYANSHLNSHLSIKKSKGYASVVGDHEDFDPAIIMEIFGYLKEQFWWGADYYRHYLPAGGSWLTWDKRANMTDFEYTLSEFELCWSKVAHHRKILRVQWFGAFGTQTQDIKQRVHPTQKPLEVYVEIMNRHSDKGALVIDTYLGSGTTLIAAQRTGRICYGCEIDPKYADVVLRRFTAETGQTAQKVEA